MNFPKECGKVETVNSVSLTADPIQKVINVEHNLPIDTGFKQPVTEARSIHSDVMLNSIPNARFENKRI